MKERDLLLRLRSAHDEGLFSCCVVGTTDRHGIERYAVIGTHPEAIVFPKRADKLSVFDVASVTKAIPLSVTALALAEKKVLNLEHPVAAYIPTFATSSDKRDVTVQHLLANVVDFALPPLSSLKDESASLIVETVCAAPLRKKPGTSYCYSNASALLLSVVVMSATGEPLGRIAKRLFFDPLGMQSTTFDPVNVGPRAIVPTEKDRWRGRTLRGEVQDESTFVLQKQYGKQMFGIAGLWSTAPDLLKFLNMLLAGGIANGRRYLQETTVREMFTNHFTHASGAGGLGWQLYPQPYMGNFGTPQTFGKTGFTGCMVMGDLNTGKGLVILSNYHYPRRKTNMEPLRKFQADIADIVFGT